MTIFVLVSCQWHRRTFKDNITEIGEKGPLAHCELWPDFLELCSVCSYVFTVLRLCPYFLTVPFSVLSIATMSLSKPTKKRKVDHGCRVFKDQWTQKFFFVQNKDKAVCLICMDSVSVFKECNIERHYDARHKEKYDVFQSQVRTDKSNSFQRAILDQHNIFKYIFPNKWEFSCHAS
jgi:hypothetical protein